MSKQEFSIPALMNRLQSEHDAYELLESLRWENGEPDACPVCGAIGGRFYFLKPQDGSTGRKTRTGSNSQRRVWKCATCRKQFSALTGTIFHGTKISIRTCVLVILEMCASKNGVSAREIERKYDLTAKSAWFMLHRIREAMKRGPLASLLEGTVIADETWIGGQPGTATTATTPTLRGCNAYSAKSADVAAPTADRGLVLRLGRLQERAQRVLRVERHQ